MYNGLLVRYGEIFLKTDIVRRRFEHILISNVSRGLEDAGIDRRMAASRGRIFIETSDVSGATKILPKIFGIVSFSPAVRCDKDYKDMKKHSLELAGNFTKGSFAVDARRSDKSFSMTSQDIKEKIGNEIRKKGFRVDLSKPVNRLFIEVHEKCYIYDRIIAGPGGMPLGTAGAVAGFLRDGKDMLADWMLMKRGAEVIIAGRRGKKLYAALQGWCVGRKLRTAANAKSAEKMGAVAMATHRKIKTGMVLLDPLCGFSDKEIEERISLILGKPA